MVFASRAHAVSIRTGNFTVPWGICLSGAYPTGMLERISTESIAIHSVLVIFNVLYREIRRREGSTPLNGLLF